MDSQDMATTHDSLDHGGSRKTATRWWLRRRWLTSVVAVGAGVGVYLAVFRFPARGWLLLAATALLLLLAAGRQEGRGERLLGVGAVAAGLGFVGSVEALLGKHATWHHLMMLTTALACGCTLCLAIHAWSLRGSPPGPLPLVGHVAWLWSFLRRRSVRMARRDDEEFQAYSQEEQRSHSRQDEARMATTKGFGPPGKAWSWPCPLGRPARLAGKAVGPLLVLTAGAIPIGEGITFACGGILALAMLVGPSRGRLCYGPTARRVVFAFLLYGLAGILAIGLGGEGWLRPGELGLWGPFLLMPIMYAAALSGAGTYSRWAVAAFLGMLALSSVSALAQYCLNLGFQSLVTAPFAYFSSQSQAQVPGLDGHLVAGGFFLHRLKMAHVLLIGIAVLTGRQLFAGLKTKQRCLELAVMALFGVTLLLTFTRSALLGLMVGLGVCLVFAAARSKILASALLVVALPLSLSVPQVRQRIASVAHSSAFAERSLIWEQGVDLLREHPLGIGLGNYPSLARQRYARIDAPVGLPRTYAHNLVLAAWVESGPVGLLAYVAMWVIFTWRCILALGRRASRDEQKRTAAAAGLFAATAFWAVGLSHDVLYHKPVALAFVALCGMVLATLEGNEQPAAGGKNDA